jgi:hypothetical protein
MATTHRLSTTGALIVCLVGTQWSGPLFASEEKPSSSVARSAEQPPRFTLGNDMLAASGPLRAASMQPWHGTLTLVPESTFAQRRGYRGRGRGGRNGSAAAIVLGAAATIAGGAVLVYANRPECSTNPTADGCGYGTKVVGGAVLSAGLVGLVVGAVTWR